MAFYDRVRVAIPTKGAGSVAIGPAAIGYRTLAQAGVPASSVVSYVIEDLAGGYELGRGQVLPNGSFERTTILNSSNAGGPLNLSGLASLFLSPLADNLVALGADGRVAPSALVGSKGYANIPQLVIGAGDRPPAGDGGAAGASTTAQRAPVQLPFDVTDPDGFAVQCIAFGGGVAGQSFRRGAGWLFVHTPSDDPSNYLTASPSGAPVKLFNYQASTGGGQTGHVGLSDVRLDGEVEPNTSGEAPGRDRISTGTGYAQANSPGYYGVLIARVYNRFQQLFRPGQTYHRLLQSGVTMPAFGVGTDFGANELVGPGGSLPGRAARKNLIAQAKLLDVPEVGAEEFDSDNDEYRTGADGVRRRVITTTAPKLPWVTDPATAFLNDGKATRTYRAGRDWLEITVVVGGTDIVAPAEEFARLNLQTALTDVPAIVSFNMVWSDGVGRTADCYARFRGNKLAIAINADTGRLLAGRTYVFTMLFR